MLTLEKISKSFGKKSGGSPAIDRISFAISKGEVMGIVGASGAGKTTLLRIMSLQMLPDDGVITFGDQAVTSRTKPAQLRSLVQQSATVFQGFSLLYNRNVLENVALPLKLRGAKRAERELKAMEMLNFVGLAHHAKSSPITLSGGEAQRVAIARALSTDPKVLFLDEPTSALDGTTAHEILDVVRAVHRAFGMTIVLVSHQIEVVRYMCDRVIHLQSGKIKRMGEIDRDLAFQVRNIDDLWGGRDV